MLSVVQDTAKHVFVNNYYYLINGLLINAGSKANLKFIKDNMELFHLSA